LESGKSSSLKAAAGEIGAWKVGKSNSLKAAAGKLALGKWKAVLWRRRLGAGARKVKSGSLEVARRDWRLKTGKNSPVEAVRRNRRLQTGKQFGGVDAWVTTPAKWKAVRWRRRLGHGACKVESSSVAATPGSRRLQSGNQFGRGGASKAPRGKWNPVRWRRRVETGASKKAESSPGGGC
jgi:hypothetical protein